MESSASDQDDPSEFETWREVHSVLMQAVTKAKEGVAIQKAQRRFWLEELAANLAEDGKLEASSNWKPPSKFKSKKPPTAKQKKKESILARKGTALDGKPAKKPRKNKGEKSPTNRTALPESEQETIARSSPVPEHENEAELLEAEEHHPYHQHHHEQHESPPYHEYAPHQAAVAQSHHWAQPPPPPPPRPPPAAAAAATQSLQMMAAVAFGAPSRPAPYAPRPPPYWQYQQQQPPRNYSSLQELADNDEEDSDQDHF